MHSSGVRFTGDKNSSPHGGDRLRSWDSLTPPKEREGAVRVKQNVRTWGTPALKGAAGQERTREFEFISGKLGDPADHKQNLTWSNENNHGDL